MSVVQARSDVQETRELLRLAADTDFIAGVVGWVDLTSPDLARPSLRNWYLPERVGRVMRVPPSPRRPAPRPREEVT